MAESEIRRRWSTPVRPLAVKDTYDYATADLGRATLDYAMRLSPDDKERVRLGYVCIKCWEPHDMPFPEACSLCGFPMRDEQPAEFQRVFKGVERDPRASLIEKELDRVDDTHERNFYETKSGIVVPRYLRD